MNYLVKALIALTVAGAIGLAASPALANSDATVAADSSQQQTATYEIQGMVSDSCPVLVRAAVKREQGVVAVSADRKTKRAVVRFKAGVTSAAKILDAIRKKTGFKAKIVSVE